MSKESEVLHALGLHDWKEFYSNSQLNSYRICRECHRIEYLSTNKEWKISGYCEKGRYDEIFYEDVFVETGIRL